MKAFHGTLAFTLLFLAFAALPAAAQDGCSCSYSELTLVYNGDETATVSVQQTVRGGKNQTIFNEDVDPGEEFTLVGVDDGKLGPTVRIRVNGKMNATIRTNCSIELTEGYTRGDFSVVSATKAECDGGGDDGGGDDGGGDDTGGDDTGGDDGGGDPDCAECEGQVSELTIAYNGEEAGQIFVTQMVKNDHRVLIYNEFHEPGDLFTIYGANRKGTLGPKIRLLVDAHVRGRMKTSCEEPIGPGTTSGPFEVVEGYSRKGGRLCPLGEDGEDGGEDGANPDCGECDGQVQSLALRYNGDVDAHVEVTQRFKNLEVSIFDDLLAPGDPFEVFGVNNKDTLGPYIWIYVEGERIGHIHTSCSEPIGPGTVLGDFEVIDGFSRNGGRLCPLPAGEEGSP